MGNRGKFGVLKFSHGKVLGKNNRIKIGYLKHDILIFLKNILEKIKYPQFLF